MTIPGPASLSRQRSAALSAGLAVTAGVLWALLDCLEVQVAFSRQSLSMSADVQFWNWTWRWAWLVHVAAIGLALARWRHGEPGAAWSARPLRIAALTGSLAALRLLCLWSPIGHALPYLSLLWAPHATWALGLAWLAVLHLGQGPGPGPCDGDPPLWREALLVFAVAATAYAALAVYVCQMTMLHGDETHYMAVTQSLLRDGDMDLANDLTAERIVEYHVVRFGPHRAPASPEGRVYSTHPIGLSALMVPPYWAGLHLWANPRLACSLAMAVVTAVCLGLAHLWLRRLGMPPAPSTLAVALAGTTTPVGLYSNQLYPELPGLAIVLAGLCLLTHLQRPRTHHRDLGRHEPAMLAALTVGLGLLPFLHPRYAPAAALIGGAVVVQALCGCRRRSSMAWVAVAALAAGIAHLSYNLNFSGDWLGPLRPGNAWDENALSLAVWWESLPGHWLHRRVGLLNSSPAYLLAIVGLAALAARGDRRALVAAALYATTAAVNGLHPDWTFGFCIPARFTVMAIPALLIGVAASVPVLLRSASVTYISALGVVVSWDTVARAIAIPETAYTGDHLGLRAVASFYPFEVHFPRNAASGLDLGSLTFWVPAAAGAALLGSGLLRGRGVRAALCIGLALLPGAWGKGTAARSVLAGAVSPRVPVLDLNGGMRLSAIGHPISRPYKSGGRADSLGNMVAPSGEGASHVAGYFLPIQPPGVYHLRAEKLRVVGDDPAAPNRAVIVHRRVLPAVQEWELRTQKALAPTAEGRFSFDYMIDRLYFGYLHYTYGGTGALSIGPTHLDYHPFVPHLQHREVGAYAPFAEDTTGTALRCSAVGEVGPGRYLARFHLSGAALSTLTERKAEPVALACLVLPTDTSLEDIEDAARRWQSQDRRLSALAKNDAAVWPAAERLAAPWWASLPGFLHREYELEFSVPHPSTVVLLTKYEGHAHLELPEITLHRQSLARQHQLAAGTGP